MHVLHCNQLPNCLAADLENKLFKDGFRILVKGGKLTASSMERFRSCGGTNSKALQVLITGASYQLTTMLQMTQMAIKGLQKLKELTETEDKHQQ